MSAGALHSAIDTVRKDEHTIIITESQWFDNLQATIRHADKTPKSEAPYYAPLASILETYAATCSHPDLEVVITPQGCFEALMDFSPQVKRQVSDFSFKVVLKNPDNLVNVKGRLAGWVEAKPKVRSHAKGADNNGNGSADMGTEDEGGKEMDAEDWVERTEAGDESDEAGSEDEANPGDKAQRLVADLPQLCKQAHHAFHEYPEDVIHALLTYGMTFFCFRFTRPANWDSVRGTGDLKYTLPHPVFSDEPILLDGRFNPCFQQAIHLLTAPLGLSYQPSWFQLPSGYHGNFLDLAIATEAVEDYKTQLEDDPASSQTKTSPSKDASPSYSPTASEAAAPVAEFEHDLRSGKGPSTTFAPNLEPVAENEGIEAVELVLEQQDRADAASSDTDDSTLAHRPQPKLAQSGHAWHATDAPTTSSVFGTADRSAKDIRSLAGDACTPAFVALASGVQSKNTDLCPEASGPALSALLSTPINEAPTSDGLGGFGPPVHGHLSASQEATDDDSGTGTCSGARSCKRKGRPSSPLGADSPNPDPAEDSAPALAGPSKKQRLAPQTDELSVDDITAGASQTSRMEAEVSAGATNASLDDAAAEFVYNPLTAPVRARLNPHVYKSSHARKQAAKTASETATAITEPEMPCRIGTHAATAGPSRVRDPPPKERLKKDSHQ